MRCRVRREGGACALVPGYLLRLRTAPMTTSQREKAPIQWTAVSTVRPRRSWGPSRDLCGRLFQLVNRHVDHASETSFLPREWHTDKLWLSLPTVPASASLVSISRQGAMVRYWGAMVLCDAIGLR